MQPAAQTTELAERTRPSRTVLQSQAANELVFAVVGHVGSGTSETARTLQQVLTASTLPGGPYQVEILKARQEIFDWAKDHKRPIPDDERDNLDSAEQLQNLGDAMRLSSGDNAAIGRALVKRIRQVRALKQGTKAEGVIVPDGTRRAYILDALRHPAEANLLRNVYRTAFTLIGVVADADVREVRLSKKFRNAGQKNAHKFMTRDARAKEKHGQRVSDTFHLADFFLDNSADRFLSDGVTSNPDWDANEQLSRLIKIIAHSSIARPTSAETAMYSAHGSQMRSACLSRQVGAALLDRHGNLIATGSNEVPKAGGGVYGQGTADAHEEDHRCAFRSNMTLRHCSNTREQNGIIQDLFSLIPQLASLSPKDKDALQEDLRSSRIGSLLEFSRAVHAEMDAILSAARRGMSPVGGRLFVTTYPCHYCARHIVASGIDEVQFIEPYPKSMAMKLHSDSIEAIPNSKWLPPSQGGSRVLFRPFTGVAPRMYARAFLKDRPLKDDTTGEMRIGTPDWASGWSVERISYAELEVKLAED